MRSARALPLRDVLLVLLPVLAACAVFAGPLAFVPVPWPDDSAFYLVAKDLFRWPPRWVMLSQAPFEPTYRLWNFNTLPLYPALIGLGRFVGIDGTRALKLWPLSFWALSGGLAAWALRRERLWWPAAAALVLLFAGDPILRWGAVVVRPESLIGLAGVALAAGFSLGWFEREPRGLWDPAAALLAAAAYAHFNAVHLLFLAVPALVRAPRRLLRTGALTALYLSPWLATVALHPALFARQMSLQWGRLAVHNAWLSSPAAALSAFFPAMGCPEVWPLVVLAASAVMWVLVLAAGACLLAALAGRGGRRIAALAAPAGWVAGSVWLFHTKPEGWFVYYIHLSLWMFLALAAVQAKRAGSRALQGAAVAVALPLAALFLTLDAVQWRRMSADPTWTWAEYRDYVSCVDRALTSLREREGGPADFRVWNATYPDVIVELSRRHPDWDLSRANDFVAREDLAEIHARRADAVVVTDYFGFEQYGWSPGDVDADWAARPDVRSYWLSRPDGFFRRLEADPSWKRKRWLCRRGRWQAFVLMDR